MADVVAATLSSVQAVQSSLSVLTALSLTTYKYPQGPSASSNEEFDFIIVGGGTAGCVLANRLTEVPDVNVLVIEAGGLPTFESTLAGLFVYEPNTAQDWKFASQNDKYVAQHHLNGSIVLTSGKSLGGSSVLNHMLHIRGDPHDFESWVAAAKDDSWSYENLLPYFKKSENLKDQAVLNSPDASFFGTDGYIEITRNPQGAAVKNYIDSLKELGLEERLDTNTNVTLGVAEPMYTISTNGIRQSTAESFISPIKDRKNLKILLNTLVTKIVFDENQNAVGVEAVDGSNQNLSFKAKREVVLSGGAFNSPQVLMLSGVGPKAHLESLSIPVVADSPSVGQNLQDHISVIILHKTAESNAAVPAINPGDFPLPIITSNIAVDKDITYPQYQAMSLVFPHDAPALIPFCSVVFGFENDVCKKMYDANIGRDIFYTVQNLLRPKSRGQILLENTDPKAAPLIYLQYFKDNDDLEVNAKYVQDFARIVNTTYFKSVNAEMVDFDFPECVGLDRNSAEYFKCYTLQMAGTTYHYSGTCAMGTVLDSRLRVNGVKNLRVVDASIMPDIVRGNINAAILATAEKAADMIKKDNFLS